MLSRFLASIDAESATARLDAEETRHLSQVLRIAVGDEVAVFDGAGREFRARVERIGRDGAAVRLLEAYEPVSEPLVRVTLVQAALKGERMDEVVRDATMMGVAAIEPIVSEHMAAHLKPGGAPARWSRIALASVKQCRRAVVPRIGSGVTFADWLTRDESRQAGLRVLLVEPSAGVEGHPASVLQGQRPSDVAVLVGPEGGWSGREIEAAAGAGYVPVTLGRRTLRADAVPLVALGVLLYLWGDL
ncbi:MAG TPA: RsmE family RNA methyltransferase [Vicinamibacterales bacterium]|jgi:16S rRNA (uracil1498-N3)-methyltransferase